MPTTSPTSTSSAPKIKTTTTAAYAAHSATAPLAPFSIERRNATPHDVEIKILYCGVCHSDLHQARNDWGWSQYPLVPGHEVLGRVTVVGSSVTKWKTGDLVGVGCFVDTCRKCEACRRDLGQYCSGGMTQTYNSPDAKYGGITYGGYSQRITVDENYVLRMPTNLDIKALAPLLCAGITTYSPLKHWKVKKGDKVGVIGLGGLGHMGVKFAAAMGAHTVMITTSPSKGKDAKKLGAHEVLLSTDEAAMTKAANTFDFLLNTIPVGHNTTPYVNLLKLDATMCIVGAVEPLKEVAGVGLIMGRKSIAGSLIGGIGETQEMLDFCGKHNIVCDVEVIKMQDINAAYERMLKNDVKYRFVIDMASLA
ncbi:MAG: NAD(P)-dependent alcohol dehydrogenase [Planctomycetes bacterium]|nr:NAD(P)-dependent alcohol dehydrogenase [Planctomycetota bacterium]